MNPLEPSLQRFANPLARYFAATRPAFLSVTLAGVLIGLGSASADGLAINVGGILLTVFFALTAHSAGGLIVIGLALSHPGGLC